jgi:hypothetical protein
VPATLDATLPTDSKAGTAGASIGYVESSLIVAFLALRREMQHSLTVEQVLNSNGRFFERT